MFKQTPANVVPSSFVSDIGERSVFHALHQATELRNALRLNAAFSVTSGLVMAAFAGWLTDRLGLKADTVGMVRAVGIGLLGFGGYLLFESAAPLNRLLTSALQISIGDVIWVLGSAWLIVIGAFSFAGGVAVGVVGLIVADFAVVQLRARSRTKAASAAGLIGSETLGSEAPAPEAVLFRRDVGISAQKLWPVMIDHELYGRLAPNLGGATAITDNGPGLVRECSDTGGRPWSERCTLWDEGRRFAVSVETDAPSYPYPLQLMQGTWGVEEGEIPSTSVVTMAFVFQPSKGIKGRVMAMVMHASSGPSVRKILTGWKGAAR